MAFFSVLPNEEKRVQCGTFKAVRKVSSCNPTQLFRFILYNLFHVWETISFVQTPKRECNVQQNVLYMWPALKKDCCFFLILIPL